MKLAMLVLFSAVVAYQEPMTLKEKCPALVMAPAPECAGLDAVACDALAQEARQGEYVGAAVEKAKRLYEAACQKGHILGCIWTAELHLGSDYCRAQELFARACELGDYVSCVQAGYM